MGRAKKDIMKSTIAILLLFVGHAYSKPQIGGGLAGGFSEAEEPEEIEAIKALAAAESTTLFAGGLTGRCKVTLHSLTNFQSQVVAGTVFKFDAIFKYEGDCGENKCKQTTCRNFNVFRPLPFQCTDAADSCLELLRDR